jgi:hypothetical protein
MDGYVSRQHGFQFAGRRTPHRCLALGNHFLEQPILLLKVFDIVEISERIPIGAVGLGLRALSSETTLSSAFVGWASGFSETSSLCRSGMSRGDLMPADKPLRVGECGRWRLSGERLWVWPRLQLQSRLRF